MKIESKNLIEQVKNELNEIQMALNSQSDRGIATAYSDFEYHNGRYSALMDILRNEYFTEYLDVLMEYQDILDDIIAKSDNMYITIKRKFNEFLTTE